MFTCIVPPLLRVVESGSEVRSGSRNGLASAVRRLAVGVGAEPRVSARGRERAPTALALSDFLPLVGPLVPGPLVLRIHLAPLGAVRQECGVPGGDRPAAPAARVR